MKDIPEADQEKVFKLMDSNPALLQTVAMEVQEKIKQGKDQMTATMEVMKEHQEELKKALLWDADIRRLDADSRGQEWMFFQFVQIRNQKYEIKKI